MLGKKVAIVSREGRRSFQWLIQYLTTFLPEQNIHPVHISTDSFPDITDQIGGCSFAIFYHSKTRGRVNVTDVQDALYDTELKDASNVLGKRNVVVFIDDLDNSSYGEKIRILQTQPSIERLAHDLFIFSTKEKIAYNQNTSDQESATSASKKLQSLKMTITGRGPVHNKKNICKKNIKWWILVAFGILIIILVISISTSKAHHQIVPFTTAQYSNTTWIPTHSPENTSSHPENITSISGNSSSPSSITTPSP